LTLSATGGCELQRPTRLPGAAGSRAGARAALLARLRTSACGLTSLVLMAAACAAPPTAGEPHVTLLDGGATLLDGARRSAVLAGQPLSARSIIETAADARLVRIEWPNGQAADLGPDTRAMIEPPPVGMRGKPAPALYLLQGWVKQASGQGAPAGGLASLRLQVLPFDGAVVVHVAADDTLLFVESGDVTLVERSGSATKLLEARAGSLYRRGGAGPASLVARAPTDQLQRVPVSFRDPLPRRYATVPVPKDPAPLLPAPSYPELRPWLTAEQAVRAGFTRRFMPLLRDTTFRRELDQRLADHEEWRPILHPPPPPDPPPAEGAARRSGG
jgi:hypothetical protein